MTERLYPTAASEWSKLWQLGVGFGAWGTASIAFLLAVAFLRLPEWAFIGAIPMLIAATYCASASISLRQRIVDDTDFEHEEPTT